VIGVVHLIGHGTYRDQSLYPRSPTELPRLPLLTTPCSLLTPQTRLTKLANSSQLLPSTQLPPVSFEQYSLIILLDSNQKPCYHALCFARASSSQRPSLCAHPLSAAHLCVILFLCFHTLAHSFASPNSLSPVFSVSSVLFAQNTRGGVCIIGPFPSLFRAHTRSCVHAGKSATLLVSWSYFITYGRAGVGGCSPTEGTASTVALSNPATMWTRSKGGSTIDSPNHNP
jgi:hypothetical protein